MTTNWERSLLESSLVFAMILSNSVTGHSQGLATSGQSLQLQSQGYSQRDSAQIAFPIPSLSDSQSLRLTLQPLNLLSNEVALPEPALFLDRATSNRAMRFENVPFAIDPILRRQESLRDVQFRPRSHRTYSELFLGRLSRALTTRLSNRTFLPTRKIRLSGR